MVDTLLESDWDKLQIFKNLLNLVYLLTICLQNNGEIASHASKQGCLVAIDTIKKKSQNCKKNVFEKLTQ